MPSSELGWYEPFSPGREDATRPASAGVLRRLIGNINHIADQASQRRVNWWPISGKYFEPEIGAASISANVWYRCWHSPSFDLHIFADADGALRSYGLRVRLSGALSAGGGSVSLRLVVAAEYAGAIYATEPAIISPHPNVAQFYTTSTTHAWLAATPQPLHLDAEQITQAQQTITTPTMIGGASATGGWLRCTAEAWALTTSASSVPRVSGVIVDEYWEP